MVFIEQIETLAATLQRCGAEVATPVREEASMDWGALDLNAAIHAKRGYLYGYLEVIRLSDVVLIANFDKADVAGYLGPNTLVEAAFAAALGKPIALLNHPGPQPCRLEALAMMTSCLDGDATKLMQR